MFKRLKIIWLEIQIKWDPILKFFEKVDEHHLYLISAGIAFNILLYLIPLILVAVYIIDLIFGADLITGTIIEALSNVLPPNSTTTELLKGTIEEVNTILKSSTILGGVGIVTLLWLSSTLLSSMRSGLNRIFDIKTPKIFFLYKIKDIGLVILIMFLVLISSYFVPLFSIIRSYLSSNIQPPYDWFFSQIFLTSLTLISSFVMFFLVYKFLPNGKIPNFIVMLSTIMSVVTIELSRRFFGWYVSGFGNYGKFYGTYAVLVSVAMWVYYLTLIMLFSAELAVYINDKRHPNNPKASQN